ncbi:hypothetical protein C0992_009076 [Termitomyces sp. T32_za158]|nr:hypothetical protein C0992_009076 [Termitomyces sp. T32_za158]
MANTNNEPTGSLQLPGTEGKASTVKNPIDNLGEVQEGKVSEDDSKTVVANDVEKTASTTSNNPKASTSSARPSLVPLGSGSTAPSSSTQHKRFSAVNINKKFLEKNSSASASSLASQPTIKAGGGPSLARPQIHPTATHSRLVTAKLTSPSPASSTSGAGWSRSSSVAPHNATGTHSPNNSSPPLPTTNLGASTSAMGASQLPHAGKVIHPQPKAASVFPGISQKDSLGLTKQVWGNVKSTTVAQRLDVRNDFPTAAEAQVTSSLRTTKPNDSREMAESATTKPARMEEADAFRGVHLDPNAHHWDEMDDDNFLDSVIEFGDGRQYKIEANNAASSLTKVMDATSSPIDAVGIGMSRLDNTSPLSDAAPNLPVRKEERFADDFDRSWPRTSPANPRDFPLPSSRSGTSHLPPPLVRPQELSAHQESARVLFNERSNRMEPYSNGQRSGQHTSRKAGLHDSILSTNEPRNAREFVPPPQSPNIQLLQKSGDIQTRHRGSSNASTSSDSGLGSLSTHNRDRDITRRDGTAITRRLSRESVGPSGRELHNERERRSEMAPPPLPAHAIRHLSRDDGRQLPPHLSQVSVSAPIRQDGKLSRGPRFPPQGETNIQSARLPSQSPTLSHASTTRMSPIVPLNPLPQMSAHDIDEVRKDVMQSAAARAKQRRQQEEEEREKEKERARRKAAELEERIKAAEAEKAGVQEKLEETNTIPQRQEEAIALIEEAVKGVQSLYEKVDSRTPTSTISRAPSLRALPSPETASVKPKSEKVSDSTLRDHTSTIPVTVQGDSWRTKVTPRVSSSASPQSKPSAPSFISPIQVESFIDAAEDDLEVVDFMDMDKFVGVSSANASARSGDTTVPQPPSRPVASDFFDETSHPEPSAPCFPANVPKATKPQDLRLEASIRDRPISETCHYSDSIPPVTVRTSSSADYSTVIVPPQTSMRTGRNQPFYKEATMSALDDVMSRIKGALDGMQAEEGLRDAAPSAQQEVNRNQAPFAARPNLQKERWIPPALRPHLDPDRQILFLSTSSEPPPSPKPPRNAFTVKLPSVSPSSLGPISKKQLQAAMRLPFPLRMDIFSFNPSVQGMKKRDLSIDDILFHKPTGGHRTKIKYRVNLPRTRVVPKAGITPQHLPYKPVGSGAFGRPSEADGLSSWRKPVQTKQEEDVNSVTKIGPTASPAVDAPSAVVASVAVPEPSTFTKSQGTIPVRPRVPKMPAGSSVAIYRDSRIDAVDVDTHTSVNFIVGSELESQQESRATTPDEQSNVAVTPPIPFASNPESMYNVNKPQINGIKEAIEVVSSLVPPTESDGQGSVDPVSAILENEISSSNLSLQVDPVPLTPQITHHTTSPWARTSLPMPVKDSPARGPDPEHLRAVWSQTSNQAGTHGVNSLEGIVDDLTALPFILQDVKSEDGETPPPSISAPPSRMSIHDVTKAFQQVPQSPSNPSSSRRTPPLTAPPARPLNYAYGLLPPPTSNIRPNYAYPPPIMSPSPSLMYPPMMSASPVPGRMPMNGHTPIYGQPMWMPMPAASAPQAHTNMMRHMTSPYPPHMVPYSPGPPMYAPQPPTTVQNHAQQSGPQVNRDRSIPLISPVIPPAGTLMYGSPVMMPAHATVAPNHGYLVPPGRSQTRVDNNGQIPQTPQQPPHSPYNPSAFRPTW